MEVPERVMLETGLVKDLIVKEAKLNSLLSQMPVVFASDNASYAVYGGTALNKAFLKQPRFSEDVDILLYGRTLQQANALLSKVHGFNLTGPKRIFGSSYRWDLAYEEDGLGNRVQVDANLSLGKEKTKSENREFGSFLSTYWPISIPRLEALPLQTLLAMKLLAICGREEGKDYYDAFQVLSKNVFIKKQVMNEAFKYHGLLFDFVGFDENFLTQAAKAVGSADEKKLAFYDAFILKKHRPDWGALKKDLVRLLKTRIK